MSEKEEIKGAKIESVRVLFANHSEMTYYYEEVLLPRTLLTLPDHGITESKTIRCTGRIVGLQSFLLVEQFVTRNMDEVKNFSKIKLTTCSANKKDLSRDYHVTGSCSGTV